MQKQDSWQYSQVAFIGHDRCTMVIDGSRCFVVPQYWSVNGDAIRCFKTGTSSSDTNENTALFWHWPVSFDTAGNIYHVSRVFSCTTCTSKSLCPFESESGLEVRMSEASILQQFTCTLHKRQTCLTTEASWAFCTTDNSCRRLESRCFWIDEDTIQKTLAAWRNDIVRLSRQQQTGTKRLKELKSMQ